MPATASLQLTRSGHIVIGVDTHKHVHVAAALDSIGGILATMTIATDSGGFKQLLEWAAAFGQIIAFGIEGTGSYGAGLTSFVRRAGHRVVEVNRPDRRMRRLVGKSDTLDAENAARAVLAGFATAEPKTADGTVEMIRQLKVAHDTAVKDRSAAMITLKAILIHAPEQLRYDMAKKTQTMLARHLAALRPTRLETPDDSIRHTLKSLARRWQHLDAEAASMVFTVMAALAEMELAIKRERITDSVSKRRAAGKDLGGRRARFTDSQIQNARRLINAGEPAAQVAKDLNMSRATLYRRIGQLDT